MKNLEKVCSLVRLMRPLKSHLVAGRCRTNCQGLRYHSINRPVHYYHSASAELYPACLFDRSFGAEEAVVGWTAGEQIAESERAVVVWAAVVAAAVEGLVVVVDWTAAVVVAAVAVDRPEVAVVAADWLLVVAVAGCFPAVAASEKSLAVAALDQCPAVAAVNQFPAAAVAECRLAVAAVWRAVLAQVAARLVDLGPNRWSQNHQNSNPLNHSLQNRHYRSRYYLNHPQSRHYLNHPQSRHRENHPGGRPTRPRARNAVESLEGLSTEHKRIGCLQEARAI